MSDGGLRQLGTCPQDISGRGRRLWHDTAELGYEFLPTDIQIFRDICLETVLIEKLQLEINKLVSQEAYLAKGSMGQDVAHPLLQEINRHRVLRASLIKQLDLPEPDSGAGEKFVPENESERKTVAAMARYRGE